MKNQVHINEKLLRTFFYNIVYISKNYFLTLLFFLIPGAAKSSSRKCFWKCMVGPNEIIFRLNIFFEIIWKHSTIKTRNCSFRRIKSSIIHRYSWLDKYAWTPWMVQNLARKILQFSWIFFLPLLHLENFHQYCQHSLQQVSFFGFSFDREIG